MEYLFPFVRYPVSIMQPPAASVNPFSVRTLGWAATILLASGLVLIAPITWLGRTATIHPDDEDAVFAQLADVPLESIQTRGEGDVVFTTPSNAHWDRVRKAWGDPGYILAAFSPKDKVIYCFQRLGLTVDIVADGKPLATTGATEPLYGYSSECRDEGVAFTAPPGTKVEAHLSEVAGNSLPAGNIVVESYWTMDVKDHLVGAVIDEEFRERFTNLAKVGASLLSASALAWLFVAFAHLRRRRDHLRRLPKS
jgi:hypothetical protein